MIKPNRILKQESITHTMPKLTKQNIDSLKLVSRSGKLMYKKVNYVRVDVKS